MYLFNLYAYIGKVSTSIPIRIQYKMYNECYYIISHIHLLWETISQHLTLLIPFAYFRKLMIVLYGKRKSDLVEINFIDSLLRCWKAQFVADTVLIQQIIAKYFW